MENGATYQKALTDAQSLGYAEADPTGDVEGYDAAGKVVILSNLLFSTELRLDNVERQGITNLTRADIELAKAEGKRWKLIATAARDQGRVSLCVSPTKIPLQHPLASVSGAANAITFSTATLGEVTLIGPGAGRRETGYALINDLLAIYGKSK